MHPESEQRAAQLAVSRYGATAAKVQKLYQQVLQWQNKGRRVDFLEVLVRKQLITNVQADELRAGLDTTQFDPNLHSHLQINKNGRTPSPGASPTQLGGHDLRQLGDYHVLRRLGEGGMGSVYLGYQEGDHQHVAIKVLPEHLAASQGAIDRFYREAKSGALLNHPNIVRILAIGKDQSTGCHYLVMEFVDGVSALELLQRQGMLSVGDAVHIALDIAKALEHAHSRNIVHRDIKPDNILITQSGLAKLTDLGLAKRTDETSHLTAARQGFGTPYYMPYEQAVNAKYADGRSDIYALGATLYQLVAGEVPFQGENHLEIVEKKSRGEYPLASTFNPAVPPELNRILSKMLARDPSDRYQTASELIVDLERSGLSPIVPSFVDADRALRDPVVRERLAAQAQATVQDLQLSPREPSAAVRKVNPNVWYLRYRDRDGQWCKAKATTDQVLKRLDEGRFTVAGEVEASHHHHIEFQPLEAFEVFNAAVAAARSKKMRGATQQPGPSAVTMVDELVRGNAKSKHRVAARRWLFASMGIVAVIVATLVAGLLFWS